jgi:hypothetical protein
LCYSLVMRKLVVILLLVATPAEPQDRTFPTPYCTDGGGNRVELGGLTCISAGCVPAYLARCEMSLNSPMWRKVQDGCPAVSVEPAAGSKPG